MDFKNQMKKRSKCIKLIAFWMILATIPGFREFGIEKRLMPISVYELICYIGCIVSALGLFVNKDWARRWAVKMLFLYFFWILYVVGYLLGPYFSTIIERVSSIYQMPRAFMKQMALVMIVIYISWPVVMIYFLTHPSVKKIFSPQYNPA